MLQVGDTAPDFSTVDCLQRQVTLSAIPGRKVVFFFPKAFSFGCTEAFLTSHPTPERT